MPGLRCSDPHSSQADKPVAVGVNEAGPPMGDKPAAFNCDRSTGKALRALCAIRRRYEEARAAHPNAPSFSVQVALGSADMMWVAAAIEVLEKAIADESGLLE